MKLLQLRGAGGRGPKGAGQEDGGGWGVCFGVFLAGRVGVGAWSECVF